MDISTIIEIWRIQRVGGVSCKNNLIVLFANGTHICTCIKTITKGIICRQEKCFFVKSFLKFMCVFVHNKMSSISINKPCEIFFNNIQNYAYKLELHCKTSFGAFEIPKLKKNLKTRLSHHLVIIKIRAIARWNRLNEMHQMAVFSRLQHRQIARYRSKRVKYKNHNISSSSDHKKTNNSSLESPQ